jgi:peptide deformylase
VSVRPLRLLGDPVLRTPCDRVTRFDGGLANLIADLIDTVQEPGRAGLAANQIGSSLAAFSYNVDGQLGYVINPRVVRLSGSLGGSEGCLSVPGVYAECRRAAYAVVEGIDLRGDPVVVAGVGELARCLQHETEHLSGELYIDRLTGTERRRVIRQVYQSQWRSSRGSVGHPLAAGSTSRCLDWHGLAFTKEAANLDGYQLVPIGRVESPLKEREQAPRQGDEGAPDAWLVFQPGVADGLADIAAGTEIIVLTWLDRAARDVLVTRPRDDPARPPTGVFSTRSPDRPNPIGLHRVEVLAVDGLRILVSHLEALDGTPIVDVKPVLDKVIER